MKSVRATSDIERALRSLVGFDEGVIVELSDRRLILTAVPAYDILVEGDAAAYHPDASEEAALDEALQDERPALTTAEVLDRLHKRAKGDRG